MPTLNSYSRKQRKQLETYFRFLSAICAEGTLGAYYLIYDFHRGERFWRNHHMKSVLRRWEITDAASLKQTLEWLLEDGHREDYLEVHERLFALPRASRSPYVETAADDPDYVNLAVVHKMMNQLPSGNIAGFGGGWVIHLCRIGQAYGYLTREEAWAFKIKAAELLHQAYDSWDEYLIGFAAGSHFRAGDHEIKEFAEVRNQSLFIMATRQIFDKARWGQPLYPGEKPNIRKQEQVSV